MHIDSGQFAYLRAFWSLSQIKPGDKFRHAEEKETWGGGEEEPLYKQNVSCGFIEESNRLTFILLSYRSLNLNGQFKATYFKSHPVSN